MSAPSLSMNTSDNVLPTLKGLLLPTTQGDNTYLFFLSSSCVGLSFVN